MPGHDLGRLSVFGIRAQEFAEHLHVGVPHKTVPTPEPIRCKPLGRYYTIIVGPSFASLKIVLDETLRIRVDTEPNRQSG